MRYYRYRPDADKFAGIGAPMADNERVVDIHFDDTPLTCSWRTVQFHGFGNDREMENGDFPSLSNYWSIPVFSQRAWDVLHRRIECCWEALPIVHPSGNPFYIIHVMETIDCVNIGRSEVARYSDGRVMEVERYCLQLEKIKDKHVFKLPLKSGTNLLVDDVFREAVEKNALRGLLFRELPMVDEGGEAG